MIQNMKIIKRKFWIDSWYFRQHLVNTDIFNHRWNLAILENTLKIYILEGDVFHINIFNFVWMMTQNGNLINIKKKRDFILSRSRARYHARKYSKCFERLTKNTISNIFKRYFILSMNYYLDSNHNCFTRKIFNIFEKLSCLTMTHTCARSGAH